MGVCLGDIQRLLFNFLNFQGSTSGTTQLKASAVAGTSVLTLPAATDMLVGKATTDVLTNKTLTGNINADTVLCTTQFDATSGSTGTTLTSVVGLSQTVVAGTYLFELNLSTVSTANTGFKCAFKLTTAVLSAIESVATGFIAAGSATQHTTTTTDQTLLFDTAAGVEVGVLARGVMTFSTGGTIAIQAAQHTSNSDTVSVLANSYFKLTRLS